MSFLHSAGFGNEVTDTDELQPNTCIAQTKLGDVARLEQHVWLMTSHAEIANASTSAGKL